MQSGVHISQGNFGKNSEQPRLHSVIEGLFPVYETDIFLASYPKSGNTWLRFLIANLLAPDKEITFRNVDDYVFSFNRDPKTWPTDKHPRFIKSHWRFFQHYPRFIYIFRDGRDALISYYHFMQARTGSTETFSEFLDQYMGDKEDIPFGRWDQHLKAVMVAMQSRHPQSFLVLQYENMLDFPVDAARKVALFCGLNASEEALTAAAGKCKFETLKLNEEKNGPEHLEKPYTFFRKGTREQWKDVYSDEDLEKFNRHAGEILEGLGYSLAR